MKYALYIPDAKLSDIHGKYMKSSIRYKNDIIYFKMYEDCSVIILPESVIKGEKLGREIAESNIHRVCMKYFSTKITDHWNKIPYIKQFRYIEGDSKSFEMVKNKVDKLILEKTGECKNMQIKHIDRDTYEVKYDTLNVNDKTANEQLARIASACEKLTSTQDEMEEDFQIERLELETEAYTKEQFTNDIFGWTYEELLTSIQRRKALLLVAPPGMGKSVIAENFCKAFIGFKDSNRILKLSFNGATEREDIIDGLRCNKQGKWEVQQGSLMKFCKTAEQYIEDDFIVFIDEINRANTERVLGEAMTCMANRGVEVQTNFGNTFSISNNVYFIATMNSYDQSVKSLDAALKDRFTIIDFMDDGFEDLENGNRYKHKVGKDELITYATNHGLKEELKGAFASIVEVVNKINEYLSKDEIKGYDNIIGNRTFFITGKYDTQALKGIIEDIIYKTKDRYQMLDDNYKESIKNEMKALRALYNNLR